VEWLRGCDDLTVLSVLTEKRLRPIARMIDLAQQREAIEVLKREAGIERGRPSNRLGQGRR
jgi:hypothetical protein